MDRVGDSLRVLDDIIMIFHDQGILFLCDSISNDHNRVGRLGFIKIKEDDMDSLYRSKYSHSGDFIAKVHYNS